jgi:Tol biopolymer transport system component
VKDLATGQVRDLGAGWSPSWSPDGSRLVAVSTRSLVLVDADSGSRHVVARGQFRSVGLSPDGATLVGTLGKELVTLPVTGGTPRRLGIQGNDPAWSPDGRTIAYSAGGIWVVAPDGSGRRQLTALDRDPNDFLDEDVQPAWSPDGGSIAFASGISLLDFVTTGIHGDTPQPEPYTLWSVRLDGSAPTRLLPGSQATDSEPVWLR